MALQTVRAVLVTVLVCVFISMGQARANMEKYFSQPTMDLLAALGRGDQPAAAAALKPQVVSPSGRINQARLRLKATLEKAGVY
jgi:hypothetical protein